MLPSDLCFLTAIELAAQIKAHRVSPVEVVDAALARIDHWNPLINAYCTVVADTARVQARDAEVKLMRSSGDELGSLFGVPFSVKDVTYTTGIRTTIGSRLFEQHVPQEDAPAVERLKRAGAILLGKTNTPELGWKGVTDNRLYGITHNPWKLGRTPGGSSGGAAAAVAAGLGPIATGTDGAGSIRIPASFCGVVGLKPSFGLVPYYPPSAVELLAHIGPIARTVRDVSLLLQAMAGPDDRDRNSLLASNASYVDACDRPVAGLRVGWSANLGYVNVEPDVRDTAERSVQRFDDLGCRVENVLSPGFDDPYDSLSLLFYSGVCARVESQPDGWQDVVDPGLAPLVDVYRNRTALDLARALADRNVFWSRVRALFSRYDVLVTPTMPLTAFPVGHDYPESSSGASLKGLAWTPFTYPFNLTGQPAITVPCGWTDEGLPVGLQIVGRRHDDATVLAVAAAFERAAPWSARRPPEPTA